MKERERYRTYTLPGGIMIAVSDETAGTVVEGALWFAQRLNEMDGNLPSNEGGAEKMAQRARLAALERIFAEALGDMRVEYARRVLGTVGDSLERAEWYASLERDGFRCVLCHHTRSNAGGVESHHIVPRSAETEAIVAALFGRKLAGIHSRTNRASLCTRCHQAITNPTSPAWHWRAIAPCLFRAIGEPVVAATFEGMIG